MNEMLLAVKVGVSTGVAMVATAAASMNIEDGRVSVVVAVTCTVFISGIVWWLGKKFQELADANKQTSLRFEEIAQANRMTNQRLDEINRNCLANSCATKQRSCE